MAQKLKEDELDLIVVMYQEKVRCPARHYGLKVIKGLKPQDILEIQVLLSQIENGCREGWALKRLFEDYCHREIEKRRKNHCKNTVLLLP